MHCSTVLGIALTWANGTRVIGLRSTSACTYRFKTQFLSWGAFVNQPKGQNGIKAQTLGGPSILHLQQSENPGAPSTIGTRVVSSFITYLPQAISLLLLVSGDLIRTLICQPHFPVSRLIPPTRYPAPPRYIQQNNRRLIPQPSPMHPQSRDALPRTFPMAIMGLHGVRRRKTS